MLLTPPDALLFFKLHRTLMFFVNERLRILPDNIATPEEFAKQPPENRLAVRNAFLDKTNLIGAFVDENPAQLAEAELAIVRSWRQLVHGKFYIFRELKKYTVFLSSEEEPLAYGVTALTQPFEELVGPYLPVMTDTVLLPFKDKIVYDGLLAGPGVSLSFGAGIRRMLDESYQKAKDRYGIVTSLPVVELPQPKGPLKTEASRSKRHQSDEVQEILSLIVGMTDQFCRDRLNEESEQWIAKSLDVNVAVIRQKRDLLDGICPEAVQLLKDRQTTGNACRELRKVKPMRQIEIAELMCAAANFSAGYANCLVAASPSDQMVDSDRPREFRGLSPEDIARMEHEVETLGREFKLIEDSHGKNVLNLVLVGGYLRKILDNARVVRYLSQNHPEILSEFQKLVEAKNLQFGNSQ